MYRTIVKVLSVSLALLMAFAAFGSTPAHAAINMTAQMRTDSVIDGASCAVSSIGINGTLQGSDNDRMITGNWYDYTLLVGTDGLGTVLFAVVIFINNPSGIAPLNWNAGVFPFNQQGNLPAARPFHLDFYDIIGDPGADLPISAFGPSFITTIMSTHSPTVSQTFDPVAYGITACSDLPYISKPIDDRLNYEDVSGPVAIYCNEPGLDIYAVNPDTGKGHLVIRIEQAVLDELPDAPETTTLLASEGNVRVYQLTTGELQVVAGPDFEGKMYAFVFNGCPYEGGGYRVDVDT